MATFQNAAMPTTATGKKYAAQGIPVFSGGPNPQVYVNPQPTNTTPINPQLPPPMYKPLGAFEFSGYDKPNYHQDPAFQQGWADTMSAIGGLDPETRKRFEEALAAADPVKPGIGRGIELLRNTYNSVIGGPAQDGGMTQTPPIIDPSQLPTQDMESVPGGMVADVPASFAQNGMYQAPDMVSTQTGAPVGAPAVAPQGVPNGRPPVVGMPSTGLQGRPAGRRGGKGRGKARRVERPRPTLPNEGGQMPPVRQAPQMPGFIRAGRGLAY